MAPPGTWAWWTVRRRVLAMIVLLAVAIAAGAGGAVGALALSGRDQSRPSPTARDTASSSLNGSTTAKIAAAVQPSVVSITALTETQMSTGSGVILRSDGLILTNAHVIAGARHISVKFNAGQSTSAELVGKSRSADVALIKAVGVTGLTPARLGDSSRLAVGDAVLAVGSPLGLDGSVTSGIVSALNRKVSERDEDGASTSSPKPITTIPNAIQTDAAINPGNSGGALADTSGQVIGINTAIATTNNSSGSIGVGFAIPINAAKKAAAKIIKDAGKTHANA
jgi:putative serine protease PepD